MDSGADEGSTDVLGLLSGLSSGGITVTIEGCPLLSIDSRDRAMALEVQGAKQAGIRLRDLVSMEAPGEGILRGSETIARRLSSIGWNLTLYDRGDRILTLGSGVSRLTGHVSVNPLKLRGLADVLD
ncbi:MAG: hypothetical protein ABSF83_07815 [Nitrososphaerales archaeon]